MPNNNSNSADAVNLGRELIGTLQESLYAEGSENEINPQLLSILEQIERLPPEQRVVALNLTHNKQTPLTTLFSCNPASDVSYVTVPPILSPLGRFVTQMVALGADPNKSNEVGFSPIHYCVTLAKETTSSFQILINQPNVDIFKISENAERVTPLECSPSTIMSRELVRRGAGHELFVTKTHKGVEYTPFQNMFSIPRTGASRSYLADPKREIERLSKRDASVFNVSRSNIQNDFNFMKFQALTELRLDEKGKPLSNNIYLGFPSPSDYAAVIGDSVLTPEQKQDRITELKNLEAVAKTHKDQFEKICNDPRTFMKNNAQVREEILRSIFKEQFMPNLNELYGLFYSKVSFLNQLDKERSTYEYVLQTSLLGHRLGLKGKFEYDSNRDAAKYEGNSGYHTTLEIAMRMSEFNDTARDSDSLSIEEKDALQIVTDSFKSLDRAFDNDRYIDQARRYQGGLPIIIPCHWNKHLASAVLYKDKLYFCNKGAGTLVPSITCYKIDTTSLKNKTQIELSDTIKALSTTNRKGGLQSNLALPELKALKPEKLYRRRLEGQKVGNCTYTNTKRAADAILMALKDDAKEIKEKQIKGDPVTNAEVNILKFENIDNKKLYKSFSNFDKQTGIDECLENYTKSKDIKVLDPLFMFLLDKTEHNHKRSVETAKYIIKKLKSEPINMTDIQIASHIKNVKYPPSKLYDTAGSGLRHLEAAILQKGERISHFKRSVLALAPGGKSYSRYHALQAAGLDPKFIPSSNWHSLGKVVNPLSWTKPKSNEIDTLPSDSIPNTVNMKSSKQTDRFNENNSESPLNSEPAKVFTNLYDKPNANSANTRIPSQNSEKSISNSKESTNKSKRKSI